MAGRGLISAHRGPERSDRQCAGWLGAQASASRLASNTTLLTQPLRVAPGAQSLISKSYHRLQLLPLCSQACRHTGACTCERVAPGQAEARGRVGAQRRVAGSRAGGREPVQKALEAMRCPRLLGESEPGRQPRMGPGTRALSEPVLGHAGRAHPDASAKGNDGGTRRERPACLTGRETEAMAVLQPPKEPLLAGPNWRHESPGGAHRGSSVAGLGTPSLPCLLSPATSLNLGLGPVRCRGGACSVDEGTPLDPLPHAPPGGPLPAVPLGH